MVTVSSDPISSICSKLYSLNRDGILTVPQPLIFLQKPSVSTLKVLVSPN